MTESFFLLIVIIITLLSKSCRFFSVLFSTFRDHNNKVTGLAGLGQEGKVLAVAIKRKAKQSRVMGTNNREVNDTCPTHVSKWIISNSEGFFPCKAK